MNPITPDHHSGAPRQAMILAAGLGTRLLPHTRVRPKPLFTIAGVSLLERHILALARAGFSRILVNTFHLAPLIERFLEERMWPVQVLYRREKYLLDSAGAVAGVRDLLEETPLLVVNGDTLTDIDPALLFAHHIKTQASATLALLDHSTFNNVSIQKNDIITAFRDPSPPDMRRLAFSGMQVLSPEAIHAIPQGVAYGMVALYRALIEKKKNPHGLFFQAPLWFDCGTPQRYLEASKAVMTPQAFETAGGADLSGTTSQRLKGDGSDRIWRRMISGKASIISCDHGIHSGFETGEAHAMLKIGRHLIKRSIPVSRILEGDAVSGCVYVEDAGSTHLAAIPPEKRPPFYKKSIDALVSFSQDGIKDFNTKWCWQSRAYDKELILKMECGYFLEQFIKKRMKIDSPESPLLEKAFETIADNALCGGLPGLLHRDFQSRNIMVQDESPIIIDFQGARPGPFQYDLASLLIDPYAALSEKEKKDLYTYALNALQSRGLSIGEAFHRSYTFCAIARNLQMLGAFANLSAAGKKGFENHIPCALSTLKKSLTPLPHPALKPLVDLLRILP